MDENLFTFEQIDIETFRVILCNENHKVFRAHFPSNPILPGFLYLHICEKIFNHKIVEVKKIKFISFSKPNDILLLKYENKNEAYNVTFSSFGKKVCTLSYKIIKGI